MERSGLALITVFEIDTERLTSALISAVQQIANGKMFSSAIVMSLICLVTASQRICLPQTLKKGQFGGSRSPTLHGGESACEPEPVFITPFATPQTCHHHPT